MVKLLYLKMVRDMRKSRGGGVGGCGGGGVGLGGGVWGLCGFGVWGVCGGGGGWAWLGLGG